MTEEHGTFERLVVGHVMGDLPGADASRFRSHLIGCRECRARVAELRGIAADLADAERDELARAPVRTEAPRRVDRPDDAFPARGPRITIRHVTVATVVVVLLATVMAFWNLNLSERSATYFAVAEHRGETLEGLANGVPLEVEFSPGTAGLVVADGREVAFTVTGVDAPDDGEMLVAWFLGVEGADGGVAPSPLLALGQLEDGVLAATIEDPGGREFVITRETEPADRPDDEVLLRATLLGS